MTDKSKTTKKFLSDNEGNPSSMRLMSMLSLIVAAGLALIEVMGWGECKGNTELVAFFVLGAFAPKAIQKFAERK
ncbi:MAG: hypothetical protein F4222_08715 [Gammaproteobacteria bacterium]|nr:hypothetical protein [Gammaproteobacteria bacterium]MYF59134.1 hypothetical protein [Gammaproteobacteria bacterium]